jgi:hypothetical protein
MAAWTCSVVNAPDDPKDPAAGGSHSGGSPATGAGGTAPEGCGDGMVDAAAGETCDPPESCPMSCDDMDACTEDQQIGAPEFCNVACEYTDVTTCGATSDGCCPMGCDGTDDADCGMCGNMVVDIGETCDGMCPADCDDMDGCTIDMQTGSPSTCDIECTTQTITVCANGDGCCAMNCTPNNDDDCVPTVVTLPAIHRGWWPLSGSHNSSNNNTVTGHENTSDWNSYFIFDLSGITGTVVDVTLRLELEGYTSPDPTETVQIWDVTTNTATLEASGTSVAIYNDLQSGTLFGTFTTSQSQVGQIRTTTFNTAGRAQVQAALGGEFAVGCHLGTIAGTATQWARFSASNEARTHELVVSYY